MAAKDAEDYRDDGELPSDGLHNDVFTVQPDGTITRDPPRKSIFDCP